MTVIPVENLRVPSPGAIVATPEGRGVLLAILEDDHLIVDLGDNRLQQYRSADVIR